MSMIDRDQESFSRDYGCTPQEWLSWMPRATQGLSWSVVDALGTPCATPTLAPTEGAMRVDFPDAAMPSPAGQLHITWQVLEPRRIALVVLPRLQVNFQFERVPLTRRLDFMRVFDLHLQRGGG
jgi:hypothetical protein